MATPRGQDYDDCLARSRAARIQEHAMEAAAAAAAGIGEHGCANACYRVAALFRQKAIYWNTQACLARNPDYPRKKTRQPTRMPDNYDQTNGENGHDTS